MNGPFIYPNDAFMALPNTLGVYPPKGDSPPFGPFVQGGSA